MPVRVLHIVTYMGRGGLETMLMNYYRKIDRSLVQFDFLVHRDFEADYDGEILALGGKIHRLPPLNPFNSGYLNALDGFFAAHPEYKIVHSHLDCMAGIPLKYAKKHGVPVRIAHSHSSNQTKDLKYLLKLHFKRNIRKYATELFACSEEAGKWMFSTGEFHVLNNAIDAASYAFDPGLREEVRAELKIPANAFVIGHVGRFAPPKNHRFLANIIAEAIKQKENTVALLVGDGELRRQIEKQVQDLGIADKVIFTGVRSDVNRLLQAMDVFVLPSHFEGLGIVAVEAQASGLPCIVSDGVSSECKKTDLVHQIPLSAGAKKWAQVILASTQPLRHDASDAIRTAGYDICTNALWLQQYYCRQHGKQV